MQPILIRTLDLILSLVGLASTLPILAAIYIIGLFDTGSPLLFQQRIGRNKKLFTLVKFRTMSQGVQPVATHLVDANAITRFGGFLRRSKLDELPQLLNVLMGHMSLVGPRPCLPSQHELLEERDKRGVFNARPGITGLAQVNDVDMSRPRRLALYDQLMVDKLDAGLYLKLICVTLGGKGRGDRVKRKAVVT